MIEGEEATVKQMAKLSYLVTINEQSLTQALFLDQLMQGCQAFGLPPLEAIYPPINYLLDSRTGRSGGWLPVRQMERPSHAMGLRKVDPLALPVLDSEAL